MSAYLVEVKYKVELADVVEERVCHGTANERERVADITEATLPRTEHFDEQMNRLEIRQLIVVRVDADAEEQASVAPVNDLVVTKLTRRDRG